MAVSIFLIFPHVQTRGAGISTWHPAGFCRTGCYGVMGPDPSAVLDKFKADHRLAVPWQRCQAVSGSTQHCCLRTDAICAVGPQIAVFGKGYIPGLRCCSVTAILTNFLTLMKTDGRGGDWRNRRRDAPINLAVLSGWQIFKHPALPVSTGGTVTEAMDVDGDPPRQISDIASADFAFNRSSVNAFDFVTLQPIEMP